MAPIKKPGMSPALLWGSIGGTIVVIVALFVVINQQNEAKALRLAAEKAAAAAAAKGEAAPKSKPAPEDDGPALSGKSGAAVDDGPPLSKPAGQSPTAGGGDKPSDKPADSPAAKPTDKPEGQPAEAEPKPTGPKRKFTPKELAVVANVPNVSASELEKINALLTTWLDPNETIGANKAMRELEQIGKPAIPLVLNRLREIDLADEAKVRDATALNRALQNITGKMYEMSREISEQGVTERLMIRQSWFSWWEKNKTTFAGKVAPTDE